MPASKSKGRGSDGATVSLWAAPAPLEGVKSLSKSIFSVAKTQSSRGLSLSLQSRVLALGDAGDAVAALLLRAPEDSLRHESLVVTRLGPHLAGPRASVAEHRTALMEAFKARPQVVLLEEGLAQGGSGWAEMFRELVRSEGAQSFRGALVVLAHEETRVLHKLCHERWTGSAAELHREEITGHGLHIIEDAVALQRSMEDVCGPRKRGGNDRRRGRNGNGGGAEDDAVILQEAADLSEFCFEEDLFQKAHMKGWSVSLLVEANLDCSQSLAGFICYKLRTSPRAELHIERLAVCPRQRGRGHARVLIHWILQEASHLPLSSCASVSCSAFCSVVQFYERFGFTATNAPESLQKEKDEEDGDLQTWMELPNPSLVQEL
mmetsp:Transcript_76949/g.152369  ORF Transcript_76949/g.152369 Transcript_76949/m.152369 type:complete len:378 (-) Transcript_76949:379-1512(-)